MATCTELYIDTLGGLDLDGSTDKNLPYFVVENLATLARTILYKESLRDILHHGNFLSMDDKYIKLFVIKQSQG